MGFFEKLFPILPKNRCVFCKEEKPDNSIGFPGAYGPIFNYHGRCLRIILAHPEKFKGRIDLALEIDKENKKQAGDRVREDLELMLLKTKGE